jgi:hypothetical protein
MIFVFFAIVIFAFIFENKNEGINIGLKITYFFFFILNYIVLNKFLSKMKVINKILLTFFLTLLALVVTYLFSNTNIKFSFDFYGFWTLLLFYIFFFILLLEFTIRIIKKK